MEGKIQDIIASARGLSIEQTLKFLSEKFPEKVVFSTSFSEEDQAITHMIFSNDLDIRVFTLDTGRFFEETYLTWDATRMKYNKPIVPYCPDNRLLEPMLKEFGPNCFYDSVKNRQMCCSIRKIEPLRRALAGNEVWVTGLRAEHSPNRQTMEEFEWDGINRIIKYNPLLHWTTDQVKEFVKKNFIPYNKLHDKGFVSIGCAPCTRAIKPGEDFRAGRWWWEDSSKKECGLHVH